MTFARQTKAEAAQIKREGILADHIRANPAKLDAVSLSRSYAIPVDRVAQIIKRNGGQCG